VDAAIAAEEVRQAELKTRYDHEKTLVDRLLALRARLRAQPGDAQTDPPAPLTDAERADALAELQALQTELATHQGDAPLILPTVDEQAVAAVVQDWTGIPVGRMVKNEVQAVLELADTLNQRVIGQKHALEMIARRIQTSRARLDNPNKPIGVFLLAGTSGVGKTETALALAESLYGGEQNVITINMSEFQEAHTVSTLKGAPPGYVGYGEGGVLTEAVRRRPYSVVLLDEVEKAHPDVHELFFQVFDKGWMEDGEGRDIDFRNTIILLTSNVGSDLIMGLCQDPDLMPEPEAIAQALREPLLKVFPAALLGRLVTIALLPAVRRDDGPDRAAAARAHPQADRGKPRRAFRLQRRGRVTGGCTLHRVRVRWEGDRRYPDQHRAAEDFGGIPAAADARRGPAAGAAGCRGRRLHLCIRLTHPACSRSPSLGELPRFPS